MTIRSHVLKGLLPVSRLSGIVAASLVLAGTVSAQGAANVEQLKFQLQQQKFALQEAIADREATAFRVEEISELLADSEEVQDQIEEELEMLCEEKEALQPGSFDDCMKTSDN